MDLSFSSEQDILRKSVTEFLTKECPYEKVKELEESEEGYSPKLWKKMAELGWLEMILPEDLGGFGDPFLNIVIILEEIGKASYPSPYFSTVIQCGLILVEAGSDAQKKELLKKIADGKLIMAYAQYEEEGSYLASGINMSAKLSGDEYVLNGTKMFVNDAIVADKLIVAAKADQGITLFLVDAKASGVACSKIPTIAMDASSEVVFDNVKVSKNDVIGEPGKGWEIIESVSTKLVVAKCAEMLGGCKKSIDMTADYAKQRVQYGKPIGGFQIIQHYMANMLLAYETCNNYLYKVVWMIDETVECAQQVSALKAQVNEAYKYISERGVQIHGGVGTSREFDIGLFYRRAKAFEFMMGDTDHHYEKIAEALF